MTMTPDLLEPAEPVELTAEDLAVLEALAAEPPEDTWEDICVECGNDHACLGYILCSDCLEDEEITGAYEELEAPTRV